MMYAKISDGTVVVFPYSITELMREHPNTSFTTPINETELALFGLYPVAPRDRPPYDEIHENCTHATPVIEGGAWVEAWMVTPATSEEVTERISAKSAAVRADRNARLEASDWTMLTDAPVNKAEWAEYRQALRDVTGQPGFPTSINWPDQPAN